MSHIKKEMDYSYIESIDMTEFTINNELDKITGEIYRKNYDYIFASVYIWNLDETNRVLENLKKVAPDTKIIYGGPEVSYNSKEIFENHFVDGIIIGEGEETFKEIIDRIDSYGEFCILDDEKLEIDGFMYRNEYGDIVENPDRKLIQNLDSIEFPYTDFLDLEFRKIYYESSRGCPFQCSYCLSSSSNGVRYLSLERVKNDLQIFLDRNVEQVKFVDRTFNVGKSRTLEIFKYLIANDNGVTNFHFEITASLLDEDYFNIIGKARPGLFQFEIGVQTTNQETIVEINRDVSFEKLRENCEKLIALNNVHIHLDLIAGLPYESFVVFRKSFNDVYRIRAHQIQLGFLKVLKGTLMHKNAPKYGLIIDKNQPYEVLSNKDISYEELLVLKDIEDVVEKYHNSMKFALSLNYLIDNFYSNPFDFYYDFALELRKTGFYNAPRNQEALYKELLKFYEMKEFENLNFFTEILRYDYYCCSKKGNDFTGNIESKNYRNEVNKAIKSGKYLETERIDFKELKVKEVLKKIIVHSFDYDIINYIETSKIKLKETNIAFFVEEKNIIKSQYENMRFII